MKILFRVDASTEIGIGHVMRCIALAQACLNSGGEAIFVLATAVPALETRLKSEEIETIHLCVPLGSAEDAKETASLAHAHGVSWVVVDGYHFGAKYQQIIKDCCLRLLFIDDYGHANHYSADVVLNQNVYANNGLYPNRELNTQLLLGSDYMLLRQEFWWWRGWKRYTPVIAHKVLVTMGGSDPDNVTLKAIQGLQLLEREGLEAVVIVGGSNPHYEQLKAASQDSQFPIHLERNITNMPELMAWADVAIVSGGSTTWEMAFMGLPSLVLILAESQHYSVEKLSRMGVVVNLGWHEDVSISEVVDSLAKLLMASQERKKMAKLGQELVDGQGAVRVLNHILLNQ